MAEKKLLIGNASQVVTCASPGGPKRGAAMSEAGIIEHGAVLITNGKIADVGVTVDLQAHYPDADFVDVSGNVIAPAFVDPHTHAVFAGDRLAEFELKIRGASYMEIMAAGGGITSTMKATRGASADELAAFSVDRIGRMILEGTATIEVKSGYGLDTESEIRMLEAVEVLHRDPAIPARFVPTFLGAHTVPPEYKGRTEEYVDLVIDEMLPAAAAWYAGSAFKLEDIPCFADAFCEEGVFTVTQTRRILEAARELGFALKLHADEFKSLGGVSLAIELGATSVDHLDATGPEEIAKLAASETIGVVLPAVNFHLGSEHFADARAMIDAGCALALATDINPGSAPCYSLPLVMAIACRYQKLMPAEAMVAGTINAAYAIGMGERVGSIEVGKQADLIIVDAPDYRHLAYQFGTNLIGEVLIGGDSVFN